MLNIDDNVFNENLLLTQAYCKLQLKNTYKNYASILRSFNPEYDGREIFSFKFMSYDGEPSGSNWVMTEWSKNPLENNFYDELFENQLKHKKEVIGNTDPVEFKGKILVAEIDLTVWDGASEAQSNGLIDGYDCPPIDTWFCKTKNEKGQVLFAWIPEPLTSLANNAIDVNCVDCLYWYVEGRTESNNWHDENLGEVPKAIVPESENPQSIFSQIKKMFS